MKDRDQLLDGVTAAKMEAARDDAVAAARAAGFESWFVTADVLEVFTAFWPDSSAKASIAIAFTMRLDPSELSDRHRRFWESLSVSPASS